MYIHIYIYIYERGRVRSTSIYTYRRCSFRSSSAPSPWTACRCGSPRPPVGKSDYGRLRVVGVRAPLRIPSQ